MRPRVTGFTLVELMLALLLGALLSGAALQAFSSAWQSLRWHLALLRLEQDGRYALGLLSAELQMAGFFARSVLRPPLPPPGAPGCGPHANWPLQLDTPLALANDVAAGAPVQLDGVRLDCLPTQHLQPGSDVLGIKRSAARPAGLAGPGGLASAPLRSGYWYLVYRDAGTALSWQRATTGQSVPADSQWWELRASVFFLRRYSVTPEDGVPTLCAERLRPSGMRSECLVEGVEALHLEFGLDSDGDGAVDRHVETLAPGQWRAAREARVYLLMRSLHRLPAAPETSSYPLGARRVTVAVDGHLRRVLSATVPLLPPLAA